MWKPIEVDITKTYCLALCQDQSNKRYCCIIETQSDAPNQIRRTVAIPHELLRPRAWRQVADSFLLTTGQKFVLGPHGEWFTQEEIEAIDKQGFKAVPWVSGTVPNLSSR